VRKIGDLLRDTVRLLQVYAEPIRSHALHVFHTAYATMPHCMLLDTLARSNIPKLRHSILSPRAARWGLSGPILEAGSPVNGVMLSPNGLLLVAGTDDGRLRVWSMLDFEEVAQLAGHNTMVMSVAFTSDSLRIISGSRDSTIRVWDTQTFKELGLCQHNSPVTSVAFSPDDTLIASGSESCTVRIWNAVSLEQVAQLSGHEKGVTCVAFFPDGTRIVSVSHDFAVRIWNVSTYEPLPGIQCSGHLHAVAVSPDSTRLALYQRTSVATGILRMFDLVTHTEMTQVQILPGHYTPCAIAFSPDGGTIASSAGSGAVHVWDSSSLSNILTIRGHHGQVLSLAFSPDGSQIVSGSMDATVRIRPVASTGEQLTPIPGHDGQVTQVSFSSDGSRLVSGSFDDTVRIWDGLSCHGLAVLGGHGGGVWAVAYSPDDARVISGSGDRTIRVWDAVSFEEIAVLRGHQAIVRCVTFTPDGTLIASCSNDYTVRLWSSSTLQELACLTGHKNIVLSVAFSPDSDRAVSVSEDCTVRVWDVINYAQLAGLDVYNREAPYFFPAFSLDGKAILTHLRDDGPSWVSSDEHSGENCSCTHMSRWLITNFQRSGQKFRFQLPSMHTLSLLSQESGPMVGFSANQSLASPGSGSRLNAGRNHKPLQPQRLG
jgi:WD40 repeat protein